MRSDPVATTAVEARDLVVRYGGVTAVAGVSLTAAAGEVTVVLGPNGAGKTSTIETLEGYRRPDGGTVSVLGLDPVADHRALTPRIGVMLQKGGVYPTIRPREALRLFAAFYEDPEPPDRLLDRIGLAGVADRPWRRLSGGEQQRLSLALALVGRPEVVFLDEPTAGVDVGGRQVIRALVGELRDRGVCVVLTTHELEEAERVADRLVIVDAGRVAAAGTPGELTGGGEEIRFASAAGLDVAALGDRLAAPVEELRPGEYLVHTPPGPGAVAALTAWLAEHDLQLADLRAGRQRLEDVFLRLTAERSTADAGTDGRATQAARPARRRRRR